MSNIIKFPTPKKDIPSPINMVLTTTIVALTLGLLTAVFGPITFIVLAVLFMCWTMVALP